MSSPFCIMVTVLLRLLKHNYFAAIIFSRASCNNVIIRNYLGVTIIALPPMLN